jgi:hypothetical protein
VVGDGPRPRCNLSNPTAGEVGGQARWQEVASRRDSVGHRGTEGQGVSATCPQLRSGSPDLSPSRLNSRDGALLHNCATW